MTCFAVQHSDQMRCLECDLTWDTNDPHPPACRGVGRGEAPRKDAELVVKHPNGSKPSNPKDAVGIRKWRYLTTVPLTVMWETGIALLEGALKYGRHNYRDAGVRASVYVDAAIGHIGQWWEGEDIDKDSGLNHVTKAIASLVVLRDAMIQDMLEDDRPPKGNLDRVRAELQATVDGLFDRYPDPKPACTEKGRAAKIMATTPVHPSALSPVVTMSDK